MTIDELVREYMAGFFVGVSRSLSEDSEGPTNVDIWARGIEVGRSAYLAAEQAARAQLEALRTTAIPATFTHAEAHSICELLTEADEESERGMPSGLDPEVREHVGRLMAKVWAANTERKPEPTRPPGECAECDGGSSGEVESEMPKVTDDEIRAAMAHSIAKFTKCVSCGAEGQCGHRMSPPAPPAERFWRVCHSTQPEEWRAYYFTFGSIEGEYIGPWRPTRAEAEADGRASGLPEWRGGK